MEKQQKLKWYIAKQTEEEIVYAHDLSKQKIVHTKNGRISLNCDLDLELIVEQPEVFIEKGCLDACKALWDLNITTRESNGWEKNAYIVLGQLSDENMEIFKELAKQDPEHYEIQEEVEMAVKNGRGKVDLDKLMKNQLGAKFGNCCVLKSKNGVISSDLIEPFMMQDIYEKVCSGELFLMCYCDCCTHVFENDDVVRVFDKSKQTKSIEEYAKEKGAIYVKEEDKVYLYQFYYDRHLKYLDYLKSKEENINTTI